MIFVESFQTMTYDDFWYPWHLFIKIVNDTLGIHTGIE